MPLSFHLALHCRALRAEACLPLLEEAGLFIQTLQPQAWAAPAAPGYLLRARSSASSRILSISFFASGGTRFEGPS